MASPSNRPDPGAFPSNVVGILLAAGRSERFGGNKLLATSAGSVPLALRSARQLEPLEHRLAVIKPGDFLLRTQFESAGFSVVEVFISPAEEEGMSLSLRYGIQASRGASGWIVALADMPWVSSLTVAAIRDAMARGHSIVACRYQGKRGNPVGFSAAWGEELSNLHGDQGARSLLTRHAAAVCWIDVDDPGILRDVDYPGDWAEG